MFSVRLIIRIVLLGVSLTLAGCDGLTDDLRPSGDDNRPPVEEGILGTQVGQIADNFWVQDTLDEPRDLYNELAPPSTGVVLYFTMWCSLCNFDARHMQDNVIPNFPEVTFFLVDFVSDSVTDSRISQLANSFGNFETLVDSNQALFELYNADMGTTIVIDSEGNIIRMNEVYKDGIKLIKTLEAL